VGDVRYVYRIVARKPKGNGPLGVGDTGAYRNRSWYAGYINLAQDTDQWQFFVKILRNHPTISWTSF
jgi:hypothetical protein